MDFAFTDEQQELREMARAFLAEHSGSEQVRAAMASERGFDDPSVEAHRRRARLDGGDRARGARRPRARLRRAGRPARGDGRSAAVRAVLLERRVSAATALRVGGQRGPEAGRWLPALAEGQLRSRRSPTPRPGGDWDAAGGVGDVASAKARRSCCRGVKRFVVDGAGADRLVVAARARGHARRSDGIGLFLVRGRARRARPVAAPDHGPDPAAWPSSASTACASRAKRLCLGEPGAAALPCARSSTSAAIALAAEQVGGAQRSLDMAVAYAKERVQFGRTHRVASRPSSTSAPT